MMHKSIIRNRILSTRMWVLLAIFSLVLMTLASCEATGASPVASDATKDTSVSAPTSTPPATTAPLSEPIAAATAPSATSTSVPSESPTPTPSATSTPEAEATESPEITAVEEEKPGTDSDEPKVEALTSLVEELVDDETAKLLETLVGEQTETGADLPSDDQIAGVLEALTGDQATTGDEAPSANDLASLFAALMDAQIDPDSPTTTGTNDTDSSTDLDYSLSLEGSQYDRFTQAFFRTAWKQNLDAALVPSECPVLPPAEYPDGYYTGQLIDTHLHMPPLSDNFDGDTVQVDTVGGSDSDFYNAIAQNDRPVLGSTVTLDEIACTLQQEGSTTAFTFFPTYQDSPSALIDLAYNAVERHGSLFIPYIQSTNSTTSGVNGEVLQQMLEIRPNLFAGLGEIGDSPTDPINLPPDDPMYTSAFETAKANGLPVYFHPGVDNHENLDRALKAFPDVKFLVHGDFVRPYIGDLMASNSNVYFTYNDIFDEITPQFRFGDKQDFIDAMNQDWDALLDQAMIHYEDLINTYPDRFMWGTDRADIVWNYHADIGQLLVKFGRDFIGRFDPEIQEKIGHLNAEQFMLPTGN
jgi:hypothetical protein